MGFGQNPLINGLIQHTFKVNILFEKKTHSNTFWLDKTFIFSSQVTMMFQKKRFFENKKIRVRFSIVDFPAKPAKQKKQVALKKSLRLHTRRAPAAEQVYYVFEKNYFFQNSWSGTQAYLGADCRRKSPLDRWRYRLPSNNLTAQYNSQFFVSLHFDFDQEAPKCL